VANYDVIVCGNISVDIIFSDFKKFPGPGEEIYCDQFEFTCGGLYNTAVTLSRLGLKVAIVGVVGNDILSRFVLENLEKEGVFVEFLKVFDYPMQSLSVAFNYENDRSIISYEDKVKNFDMEAYINSVMDKVNTNVLHISATKMAESTIDIANKRNILVSIDVSWDEEWLRSLKLKRIIKKSDLFTPNLKEALIITGEEDGKKALKQLRLLNSNNNVIVKLGSEGAIYYDNDEIVSVTAMKTKVIDTTGAGDVFAGGVITGLLKKFELKDAVKLGNYCGGYSVRGLGGTQTSPYWNQVKDEFLH